MNMLIEAEQYLAIDKKTFEQQSYRFRSPRWSDDVYNQIVATLVHGTKPNGPNQDATASLKRKILRDFSIDNDGRLIRKGSPSKPYDKVCLKEKQVFDAVALEHLFCHRMDPSIGASRETERVVPLLYHGVTRDAVREIVKLCRQCHLPEETPHDVNPRQLRVHRKLPKSIRTLLADDEVDESSSSPSSPNGKGATASVPREQNSDTSGQDNPTSDSTFAEPAAILHGPFERSKLGLPSTTDTSNAITSSVPIVPKQRPPRELVYPEDDESTLKLAGVKITWDEPKPCGRKQLSVTVIVQFGMQLLHQVM
ncbi:MAG: hypothetical protein M1833_001366 [Piccolia ochrophora]|nr:MAG: hypothetical protein M1833_001366 [Piccolia ochrophora]